MRTYVLLTSLILIFVCNSVFNIKYPRRLRREIIILRSI